MKFKFKNKFLKINFEIKLTKDFKKKVNQTYQENNLEFDYRCNCGVDC